MNNPLNLGSLKEEVDLSLSDVLSVLIRNKLLIVLVTSLFSISSIFYALSLDKYHQASLLMTPAEGTSQTQGLTSLLTGLSSNDSFGSRLSKEEALAVLRSRSFIETFISSKGLMNKLFSNDYDEESGNWISEEIPSLKDGYELIEDSMEVDLDESLITITVVSHDPQLASFLVNSIIQEVNSHLREESILDAKKSISYLEEEIKKTTLSGSKEMLYELIERQTQSAMIANTQEDYVFKVLDPGVAPIHPAGPNRKIIVIISTILGFFASIFISILFNFLNNNRSE